METKELRFLAEEHKVKNLSFDEYELTIEFDNGITAFVGHTTEYDCSVWDIDSNLERELYEKERQARIDAELKAKEKRQKALREKEAEKQKFLSTLTPEQKEKFLSL